MPEVRVRSKALIDGPARAGARSMMRAVGYTDEDFRRPLVGVAHSWIEIMPCNFNHRQLAEWVKEGIREAGGTPVEFNTIAVSDGIAMGTEGMKASLISREVVADSIELVTRGHLLDALVCISGCDKTIPGTVMALARMDIPGLMVYGGSIMPGRFQGKDVTIGDVYEAIGRHAVGKMNDKELDELEKVACPGAGACGGQFTANTMATAFEALGISPAGSSRVPAIDKHRRRDVMKAAGKRAVEMLKEDFRPSRVLKRENFDNATAPVSAAAREPDREKRRHDDPQGLARARGLRAQGRGTPHEAVALQRSRVRPRRRRDDRGPRGTDQGGRRRRHPLRRAERRAGHARDV